MALGLFVLLTVAQNAPYLREFFTDQGVLPRATLLATPFANDWLCFHMGAGGLNVQAGLACLLALLAIGLMVGWRTRWMVVGCWFLLNSMQVRNPFICDRGDLELSLTLFWGFALPLGSRWSFDARRAVTAPAPKAWTSTQGLAPACLVVQFALIYLFAAYHKNGPFWLGRGDGLEHSLISPLFATQTSLWFAQAAAPWLHTLNYAVIAGELFVALLLLCPFSVAVTRGMAVCLLVIFHLAVGLLFDLGLFPWLGALLPLALLPAEFWSGWGRPLSLVCDRYLGAPHQQFAAPAPAFVRARELVLGLCLALAVLSNLATVWPRAMPSVLEGATQALRLTQHWELFSPIPPYYGTFTLQGTGVDGKTKLFFAGPPTRERPELSPFPNHRFRMLMASSLYAQFGAIRPGLVRVLAERSGGGKPTDYSFAVSIPDAKTGQLAPPTTWRLWTAPAGKDQGSDREVAP